MPSDDIIYYHIETGSGDISSHQKFCKTRSTQKPCRKLPETPQLLFQSSQGTRCKIAEAIHHRGHRSRCCRPDPAASQHASETNENLCRTFQTWLANMHRKPIRIYAELFKRGMVQHASETNENLCRTFQTWITQHASETNQNLCRTSSNMNEPTYIRNQWESMQNFPNMNQPTWITNHAQANRHKKKKQNKTCRQLNKTKAPAPDQQSSTSRSDAHIRASLYLFMAALPSWLRGGGFRQSRCQFTCREARRTPPNQTQTKKGANKQTKQGCQLTSKQTNDSPRPQPPALQNLCPWASASART